jgi:hypothetical protein
VTDIGRTIVRRLLSAAIAVAAAGLVPATVAFAGTAPASAPGAERFGVRLVDVPVTEAHNPRGLRYIIDYLPPGSVIHRRILVISLERRRVRFSVYPDAARITRGLFIGDAGAVRSELTSWITVQHPVLTLGPYASAMDMVTIRVPKIATRGEHYGVIWVQQSARVRAATGLGINEVARVGVRIYLAVGPGGAPPTTFAITSLAGHRAAGGRPLLVAHVHNTGGRAVDLSGVARLSDGPGGTAAGPYREQQVLTLAPGQAGNVTFAPPRRLPSGPWHAKVTLVSGFTTRTVQAVVQFSAGPSTSVWSRSAALVFGGGLAVGLGVIGLVTAQRIRRTRRFSR